MKKITLVGGGTGGHITPLVSIYNKLHVSHPVPSAGSGSNNPKQTGNPEINSGGQLDIDFFWIGENGGMEQDIAKDKNIRFYGISAGKLRRYFTFKTFLEPFKILSGIIASISILKKEKPELIFSKGGFVSLPVAIAAKILGIKLYLHESDTIPGLANRYVGKFASRVYLGFSEASKYFDTKKVKVVGQILNDELFERAESGEIRAKSGDKTNLLVIAGSQGSTRIFKMILDNMESLTDFNIEVVLGSLNKNLKSDFDKFQNTKTYEFINQETLGTILANTDIAITRAGATSLAELEAFNIKMLIIPLKESANNHQYHNALAYKEKGEIMILEEDLSTVPEILKNFKDYKKAPQPNKAPGAIDIIKKDFL